MGPCVNSKARTYCTQESGLVALGEEPGWLQSLFASCWGLVEMTDFTDSKKPLVVTFTSISMLECESMGPWN
jgi:hypothetical protein